MLNSYKVECICIFLYELYELDDFLLKWNVFWVNVLFRILDGI